MAPNKVSPDDRLTVLTRALFCCEYCGKATSELNIHHRTPRGMGGTKVKSINEPANLLALCGSGTTGCHGWVESNRLKSYELGLLVHRGQAPWLVPFQNSQGKIFVLREDGTKYLFTVAPDLPDVQDVQNVHD